MKKSNMVLIVLGCLLLGVVFFILPSYFKTKISLEQTVLQKTLFLSKEYLSLRYQTDTLLMEAKAYEYDVWNKEMGNLLKRWEQLDKEALVLEEQTMTMSLEDVSFNLFPQVSAYNKQEISDVFDKAPAGKKIRTLAKFLGVDAKRAFKILQQDQEQVKADAWNEAGDTFQKLETSAVVIKDGCKVAGFVGGVIITGGAGGFAAAGVVSKTAVVIAGADLVLEVTEDAANISLGNNNKVTEIAGDIRKITEPAAAILAITDLPKNVEKGIDILNVVVFGADQFRSTVQDGKIIGIKLPAYEGDDDEDNEDIEVVVMDEEEVDDWLEEDGYEREDGAIEELLADNDDEEDDIEEDQELSENNELDIQEMGSEDTVVEIHEDEISDEDRENSNRTFNGNYDGILAGENIGGLIVPAKISVVKGKVDGSIDFTTVITRGETDIPFTLHIDIAGIVTIDERLQCRLSGTASVGDDVITIWGTLAGPFTNAGGIVDIVGEFSSAETEKTDTMDPMHIIFTRR